MVKNFESGGYFAVLIATFPIFGSILVLYPSWYWLEIINSLWLLILKIVLLVCFALIPVLIGSLRRGHVSHSSAKGAILFLLGYVFVFTFHFLIFGNFYFSFSFLIELFNYYYFRGFEYLYFLCLILFLFCQFYAAKLFWRGYCKLPRFSELKEYETANTFKFNTFLWLLAGVVIPIWPISLPICWFLAYRSYRYGTSIADQIVTAQLRMVGSADFERWNALVCYDDDISRAVQQLEPYGAAAIEKLRVVYSALNDKSKLDKIVSDIQAEFRAQQL
ncbi:hypothetical protein [Pannonibacter sp.]|uniref:hypothetical protein n=1 Tax=Pannonibacter sp. TaxID=1906786 RepID=UPI003F71A46A